MPTSQPMAAAVVARMRGGKAWSRVPFDAPIASRLVFSPMATSPGSALLRALHQETIDAALLLAGKDLVAGLGLEGLDVGDRPGIGGQHLHDFPHLNPLEGLGELDDGEGAEEPLAVESLLDFHCFRHSHLR